jgi:hypothetical protein
MNSIIPGVQDAPAKGMAETPTPSADENCRQLCEMFLLKLCETIGNVYKPCVRYLIVIRKLDKLDVAGREYDILPIELADVISLVSTLELSIFGRFDCVQNQAERRRNLRR